MYGLAIPRYAREYLSEWKRSDRHLRLRWSLDQPGAFILERKTKYLFPPGHGVKLGTDRAIQLKDDYRKVFTFWPNEIKHVAFTLAVSDVQRLGGAKELSARLIESDDNDKRLLDRAYRANIEAATSDLYDRLAWEEKRRISLATAK